MAIQGLTSNKSIPDTLWNKIQEFQKKGSTASFMNSIEANKNYFQLNNDILNAIMQTINEEEKTDMQMRQSTNLSTVRPSAEINVGYKQQVENYRQKMQQAAQVDVSIAQKY
jgi:hypothetical protein